MSAGAVTRRPDEVAPGDAAEPALSPGVAAGGSRPAFELLGGLRPDRAGVRTAAVLLCLLFWAFPLTAAAGGRDGFVVTAALLLLLPALCLVRPWRVLGPLDLLALAPAGAALVACLLAPTGFDGIDEVAALGYAGLLFCVLRGHLVDGGRAAPVVGVVLLAGLAQFAQAWWAWFGGQDTTGLMVGTFFWHNQFAVFMAATGVLGAAVALRGSGTPPLAGPLRLLGALTAVVTVPSLLLAASRSTLALAVVAFAVLILVELRRPRRVLGAVLLVVLGGLLTAVLTGPLLMAESSSAAANLEQRQTLTGNGSARIVYAEIALELLRDRPLTGAGFDSFGPRSGPLLPPDRGTTTYVHNGFLQAFVDGGVLLGASVAAAALLPCAVAVRRALRGRLGRRGDRLDAITLGASGAAAVLVLHSAVDFDWTYPSLLALLAIIAALLTRPEGAAPTGSPEEAPTEAPVAGRVHPRSTTPRAVLLAVATFLVLAIALPASVRAAVVDAPARDVPRWAVPATLGLPVHDVPAWARGVGECRDRLVAGTTAGEPDRGALRADLACTAEPAEDMPYLQASRARALMRLGDTDAAERLAARNVDRWAGQLPRLVVLQAALPADADRPAEAAAAVRAVRTDPRVAGSPDALAFADSVLAGLDAAAGAPTTE